MTDIRAVIARGRASLPGERWKPFPSPAFCRQYAVSNKGRIFSLKSQKVLCTSSTHGYRTISIRRHGVPHYFRVHRIVLLAFRGKPPRGFEAAHLDSDRANNALTNLRWMSHVDNLKTRNSRGERHSNAVLTENDVRRIRELRSGGMMLKDIGKLHGVTFSAIGHICSRKNWSHVP